MFNVNVNYNKVLPIVNNEKYLLIKTAGLLKHIN